MKSTPRTQFALAFALILKHEGGYVNDPKDPGGETIYGISKRAHPAAWEDGAPSQDDAEVIYKRDYWDACHCDELPPCLAVLVFDTAVNIGAGRAVKQLQSIVNVPQDGDIGPKTLAAIDTVPPQVLVARVATRRIHYYSRLNTWEMFGKGWTKRVFLTVMACATLQDIDHVG